MRTGAPLWASRLRTAMPLVLTVVAVLVLLAATAIGGPCALGAVPYAGETPAGLFGMLAYTVANTARANDQDREDFQQTGFAPETIKGRIVEGWFESLRTDPAVAVAVPGGAAGLEVQLRDEVARERLIRSGIARLEPPKRLAYFMLLTKYIGKAVNSDCRGVASMQDLVDRISVGSMSDADAAEYFSLLHEIVIRAVLAAPVLLPSSGEFELALRHLDDAVNGALAGDPAAEARMQRVTSGAPGATMADVCWASGILMRSVADMNGPDRDALLLYMLDEDVAVPGEAPAAAQ
jgi:hypothetical protein